MITFKSTSDLSKLHAEHPALPIVEDLVNHLIRAYGEPYDADAYGFIALVEECDVDGFWGDWHLADIPWEGIMLRKFWTPIFL